MADAIKSQLKVDVDRRKIDLAEPIRTLGDTQATLSLYTGVKASITISVTALS